MSLHPLTDPRVIALTSTYAARYICLRIASTSPLIPLLITEVTGTLKSCTTRDRSPSSPAAVRLPFLSLIHVSVQELLFCFRG